MDVEDARLRMMRLGRQAPWSGLHLEVAARVRAAECNRPLETISARVERHFGSAGEAQANAEREKDAAEERLFELRLKAEQLDEFRTTTKQRSSVAHKKINIQKMKPMMELEAARDRRSKARQYSETVLHRNSQIAYCRKAESSTRTSEGNDTSDYSTSGQENRHFQDTTGRYKKGRPANSKILVVREDSAVNYHHRSTEENGGSSMDTGPEENPAEHVNVEHHPLESSTEEACAMSGDGDEDGDRVLGPIGNRYEHCLLVCEEDAKNKQEENGQLVCQEIETQEGESGSSRDEMSDMAKPRVFDAWDMLSSHKDVSKAELADGNPVGVIEEPVEHHHENRSLSSSMPVRPGEIWKEPNWLGWKTVVEDEPKQSAPDSCSASCSTKSKRDRHATSLLGNGPLCQRLEMKVAKMGLALPCLCACHDSSPFDPLYTRKCCVNCPLFRDPRSQERLLKSVLHNFGLY